MPEPARSGPVKGRAGGVRRCRRAQPEERRHCQLSTAECPEDVPADRHGSARSSATASTRTRARCTSRPRRLHRGAGEHGAEHSVAAHAYAEPGQLPSPPPFAELPGNVTIRSAGPPAIAHLSTLTHCNCRSGAYTAAGRKQHSRCIFTVRDYVALRAAAVAVRLTGYNGYSPCMFISLAVKGDGGGRVTIAEVAVAYGVPRAPSAWARRSVSAWRWPLLRCTERHQPCAAAGRYRGLATFVSRMTIPAASSTHRLSNRFQIRPPFRVQLRPPWRARSWRLITLFLVRTELWVSGLPERPSRV